MAKKARPPVDTVVLTDPRAIQAISHPARVEIIRALFDGEELTATECAELTGLSPSATSYHLKALERWGVVEPAERRVDGRDRPWKGKGKSLIVESQAPVATAAAESAVVGMFLDRDRAAAIDFVSRQSQEPEAWRHVMSLMTGEHWLTAAEVTGIVQALGDVLEPYRGRSGRNRPAGSRRVRVSSMVVPLGEPETG
ncbi:MAG: ArsR/SmtB family transcription factor [Acidimicrobiales bacterium]